MAEYIEREAFKSEYLCCGYLPEMSEEEFDSFPSADIVVPVNRSEWVAQVLPGGGFTFEDVAYDPHQHCGPICKRC